MNLLTFLILVNMKITGNVTIQEGTNSRDYSKFNSENFKMELLGQNWSSVYNYNDVKLISNKITELFVSCLDNHAPRKFRFKKTFNKNKLKLSKECRQEMKLRDKLRKTAKRSGLETDWITWRRQKNRVNNILRKERNIKNEENTIKLEQDSTSREIWNMIKKNAGWIKSLSPVSLSVAGKLITSPKEIGNELNKYWITRIENLCKEFINITMDPTQPLVKIWENWQGKNNVKTFEFQPITVKRMRALFKSLKKSHSECRD